MLCNQIFWGKQTSLVAQFGFTGHSVPVPALQVPNDQLLLVHICMSYSKPWTRSSSLHCFFSKVFEYISIDGFIYNWCCNIIFKPASHTWYRITILLSASSAEYQPLSLVGSVGTGGGQGCICVISLCLSVPPTWRDVLMMIVHKGGLAPWKLNTAQTKPAHARSGRCSWVSCNAGNLLMSQLKFRINSVSVLIIFGLSVVDRNMILTWRCSRIYF